MFAEVAIDIGIAFTTRAEGQILRCVMMEIDAIDIDAGRRERISIGILSLEDMPDCFGGRRSWSW